MTDLSNRLQAGYASYVNNAYPASNATTYAVSPTGNIYKAIIPDFLYKPPFGYPLNKNIPEIRRLAQTNYVAMIINTICDEIGSLEWDINADTDSNVPDNIIQDTYDFFTSPNHNKEPFDAFTSKLIRDIEEIDAGVIEKVHNLKGEFLEMYVKDGGTFLNNSNPYGVLPAERAYFQYGWLTGARPIPFDRNEIVYMMRNPRSDSLYGRSPVENLLNVLQVLVYGLESNLEYFTDNNMPKGVFKMIGANEQQLRSFSKQWQEINRTKGEDGKWRRAFHKMPIINTEGTFERLSFSNAELELLQQQEWFTKLVWSMFGITPSELGFTDSSNRATEIIQSNVFKRKTINPLVQLLEYNFNTFIINDLPWIKGKYENKVKFVYDRYDVEKEISKRKVIWNDIKTGLITPNEARLELGMDEIEGGESLRAPSSNAFGMPDNGMGSDNSVNIKAKKKELKTSTTDKPTNPRDNEIVYKPFDKAIEEQITNINKVIKDLLAKEGNHPISEIKAIDDSFIKRIAGLFSLKGIFEIVRGLVRSNYLSGIEKTEKQTNRNFLPNETGYKFLENYTFDNVKGMEKDIQNNLRQELQRAVLNNETVSQMSERVGKVMKVGKVRARAIARTESNRAYNQGELDAWMQSGEKVDKIWSNPSPEAEICKALVGKRIDINDSFKYKGQSYMSSPGHVNCNSYLTFVVRE